MPFTFKVTKDGQIRKLSFTHFPTFLELHAKLVNVFGKVVGGYKVLNVCSASEIVICETAAHDGDWTSAVANYASLPEYENALLRMEVVRAIPEQVLNRPLSMASSTDSCCSVDEGKREMKSLLNNFLTDFKKVYGETFSEELLADDNQQQATTSTPETVVPELPRIRSCSSFGSYFPRDESGNIHRGIWCDRCGEQVRGLRHKCRECRSYDLCNKCTTKHDAAAIHSAAYDHEFLTIPAPAPEPPIMHQNAAALNSTRSSANTTPTPVAHRNVHCDGCGMFPIIGVRHKCLDCADFDFCDRCKVDDRTHNANHEFFALHTPGKVVVHVRPMQPDSPANIPAPAPAPVSAPAPGAPTRVTHNANCNLCANRIYGDRYKCVECPDFDACAQCFTIADIQHPVHAFIKLSQNNQVLYRGRRSLNKVRHRAICDGVGCGKTIYGVRYKCMHPSCPDFDLCADCEALPIPVHPADHPLLKMKTAKTMIPQVSRTVTASRIPAPAPKPVVVPQPVERKRNSAIPRAAASVQTMNILDEKNVQCGFEVEQPSPPLAPAPVPAPAAIRLSPPLRPLSPIVLPMPGSLPSLFPQPDFSILGPQYNPGVPSLPEFDSPIGPMPSRFDFLEAEPLLQPSPFAWSYTVPPYYAPNDMHMATVAPNDTLLELPSPPRTPPRFEPTIINLPSVPRIDPGVARDKIPVSVVTKQESPNFSVPSTLPQIPAQPSLINQFRTRVPLEPNLVASFLEDNNIPDGHVFPPGAEFIKSWRMKNDGTKDWPKETMLTYVGGHRLGAFSGAPTEYEVGSVKSGETVDVWAGDLKAPEEPGVYNSFWRLVDGNGVYFGHRLWITIEVAAPADSESSSNPSLSSSALAMPGAFFAEEGQGGVAPMVPEPKRSNSGETQTQTMTTMSVTVSDDDSLSLLNASSEGGDAASVVEIEIPAVTPNVQEPEADVEVPPPSPTGSSKSTASDDDEFVVVYDSASEDRS